MEFKTKNNDFNWNVTKVLETALSKIDVIRELRDPFREDGFVNNYIILTIFLEVLSSLEVSSGILIYKEDKFYNYYIEGALNSFYVEEILRSEEWDNSIHIVFERFEGEFSEDDTEDIIRDFVEDHFI